MQVAFDKGPRRESFGGQPTHHKFLGPRKEPEGRSFHKSLSNTDNNQSSFLPQISEDDEFFDSKEDDQLLEKLKAKLGFFVRSLIWIKKAATDQIVFISSQTFLARVAKDMKNGKLNIYTKMER